MFIFLVVSTCLSVQLSIPIRNAVIRTGRLSQGHHIGISQPGFPGQCNQARPSMQLLLEPEGQDNQATPTQCSSKIEPCLESCQILLIWLFLLKAICKWLSHSKFGCTWSFRKSEWDPPAGYRAVCNSLILRGLGIWNSIVFGEIQLWTKLVTYRKTNRWLVSWLDGRIDEPTDGPMDTPSYRDAGTHINRPTWST